MIDEYNHDRTAFARFSSNRGKRYMLRRSLFGRPLDEVKGHPHVVWVMLNPSTADAFRDDATIRRCVGFTRLWARPWFAVVNLFAHRATDPRDLIAAADRGDDQIADEQLTRECYDDNALVVCAWGAHGALVDRDQTVIELLARTGVKLHMLALTKDGHPRHPLRLPGNLGPRRWRP